MQANKQILGQQQFQG